MKEIGGYYELERIAGKAYYDAPAFDCGRSSFRKWCDLVGVSEIYLPYYNCDVVAKRCDDIGVKAHFYHIGEDLLPILEDTHGRYVYVVNYYGVFDKETVRALAEKYDGKLVMDDSHAFFAGPYENVASFNTCRKFFGVSDGSYLFCDRKIEVTEPRLCVAESVCHLLGRKERSASDYYALFKAAEDSFLVNKEVRALSDFSENVLKGIDYAEVIAKRKANYARLKEALGGRNLFRKDAAGVPFAYPFMTKDASLLRKRLIENKVYVAKYWDSVNAELFNETERRMVNDLLPLPIDQRYGKEDMDRIIDLVLNFSK